LNIQCGLSTTRSSFHVQRRPSQHGFEAVESMESTRMRIASYSARSPFHSIKPACARYPTPISRCAAMTPGSAIWTCRGGRRYGNATAAIEQSFGLRHFSRSRRLTRYDTSWAPAALADRDSYVRLRGLQRVWLSRRTRGCRRSWQHSTCGPFVGLASQPGLLHTERMLASAGSNCVLADFYRVNANRNRAITKLFQSHRAATVASLARRWLGGRQNPYSGLASPAEFTELRYVAERPRCVDRHWTLRSSAARMICPRREHLTLEQALFAWLARTIRNCEPVVAYRTFNADDAYCQHSSGRGQL